MYNQGKKTYAEDIASEIGIDCLRRVKDVYYSIHKLDNGKYVYIFYKPKKSRLVVEDICNRTGCPMRSDIDSIIAGVTTYADIKKLDSRTELSPTSTHRSYHSMLDGGAVTIFYRGGDRSNNEENYLDTMVVDHIEYQSCEPYLYFEYFLPGDLE